MIFAVIIAVWLAVSALVCWIAGRFIRVGMVELQPDDQAQEAQP